MNSWKIAALSFVPILIIGMAFGVYLSLALTSPSNVTTPTSLENSTPPTRLIKWYYQLIFNQTGLCSNPATFVAPWAVTLNNKTTLSQPPNATVPAFLSSWGLRPSYKEYSIIVFFVPNGTYNYTVYPLNIFLYQSASVTVQGSTQVIHVEDMVDGCTA